MIYLILCSLLGVLIGILVPVIPYEYAKYTAVAIVAAFDSVIGATTGIIKNNFNIKIFVSGFFTNAIIAILLTLLGESLDVDIFLAAIFVFVTRIENKKNKNEEWNKKYTHYDIYRMCIFFISYNKI